MHNFQSNVKEKLNSIIDEMEQNSYLFAVNPGHDFTRQFSGKLTFSDTMRSILCMGKGNTSDELIDYFQMDTELIPSNSAFVQRRAQITPSAFRFLFKEFTSSFSNITHKYKNYCILAADGSHVVYSTNADIIEDYNKPRQKNYLGYNHMHLNAFVDVLSKTIIDVVIQNGQKPDERKAFHTMLDNFKPINPASYIITADRGYESYDTIFHCECNKFGYVFRVKAPTSSRSLLSTYIDELPDEQDEFDVRIKRFFTNCVKNSIMNSQPGVYHYINHSKPSAHLTKLCGNDKLAYVSFRVLKIKTSDNNYEYIITNLPSSEFGLEEIKHIYHLRWGIEVSFRYLKHAAGLLYFHSKKTDFLLQEIYASLTLYNFGVILANLAASQSNNNRKHGNNKHLYSVDISQAIKIARKYLMTTCKSSQENVIKLIMRYVHVVKADIRSFKRPLRGIGAMHFSYR